MGVLVINTSAGQIVLQVSEASGGGTQALLTQADFAYLGYYEVAANVGGGDLNYGQGFTHRYVGGQLRFLTLTYNGGYRLLEVARPASLGSMITTATGYWANAGRGDDPWPNGNWVGIHWDEPTQSLWSTEGVDYPNEAQAAEQYGLSMRSLEGDGSVSNFRGWYGMAGIGSREWYGGAVRIPAWFQSAYGVGPVGVGFGGYASLLNAGYALSLGPVLYAIPEPLDHPDDTLFGAGQFKTLMTCKSGSRQDDWYADEAPTTFDRGVRNSDVDNEFDDGNWPSPAPDGRGRWVWGDSSWNTGCWVEYGGKHGFVIAPTFLSGRAFYQTVGTNTLERERYSYEIQIYDPAHLGESANGTRPPWDVKPTSRWEIQPAGLYDTVPGNDQGSSPWHAIAGATFDATTGILYLYGTWMKASLGLSPNSRIYAYQVTS